MLAWDDVLCCYAQVVVLGSNGEESFQILAGGDWGRRVHPDRRDACPHEEYVLCGPDDCGHDLNWTIGKHALDRGEEGACYHVRLFINQAGGVMNVDWVALFERPRYYIVGTWNRWQPQAMSWDRDRKCYQHVLILGRKGWESFQILVNADWKECLHPSESDGNIHLGNHQV